jgi:Ran GTPase-activating protein (RanGAP) involved in mRNA processing and transport
MLKINRSLKELKIAFNSINDEGAKAIANSLAYNKTLEWLSLRRNGIGNVGATAFAEKLPYMHGLIELLLTKNDVDQVGVSALLDGLRSNVQLEYLSVEELVSEPHSREIMQLLRLNKAGRRIFHEENSVAPDLWPRVYGRICEEPDILFHFVSQKPDVLMYIDT